MNSNPFTFIEEKLDKIESILLHHFENKKEEINSKPVQQLPIISGMELV